MSPFHPTLLKRCRSAPSPPGDARGDGSCSVTSRQARLVHFGGCALSVGLRLQTLGQSNRVASPGLPYLTPKSNVATDFVHVTRNGAHLGAQFSSHAPLASSSLFEMLRAALGGLASAPRAIERRKLVRDLAFPRVAGLATATPKRPAPENPDEIRWVALRLQDSVTPKPFAPAHSATRCSPSGWRTPLALDKGPSTNHAPGPIR
jgi:hypothetical protein